MHPSVVKHSNCTYQQNWVYSFTGLDYWTEIFLGSGWFNEFHDYKDWEPAIKYRI